MTGDASHEIGREADARPALSGLSSPTAPAVSDPQLRTAVSAAGAFSRRGMPVKAWTDERIALLRELYEHTTLFKEDIFARINALPAPRPVSSVNAIMERAAQLGLRRPPAFLTEVARLGRQAQLAAGQDPLKREPAAPAKATPPRLPPTLALREPPAADIPPTLEAKHERAFRMLARNRDLWQIVAHTGLAPWQVCMLKGYRRMGLL